MSQNEVIVKGAKKTLAVVVLFLVVMLMSVIIVNALIDTLAGNFDLNGKILLIKLVANIIVLASGAVPVLCFFSRFIKLLSLKNSAPIQCTVEDIVVLKKRVGDSSNSFHLYQTMYYVVPLLKTPGNTLLFTYNPYNLSVYNTAYGKSEDSPYNANLLRRDGSTVKIGETVNVFIRKTKEPKVRINAGKNIVKLSFNKKSYFQNFNDFYDISVFEHVQFFEGFIDIDIAEE